MYTYMTDMVVSYIKSQDPDESWDGSYQGQPLPADDYWFRLELEDGRVYTGHFSLMR